MDAIVQFYRNALCCIKDLGLFQEEHALFSFFWDSSVTQRYYDFPPPLHQTTPLEVLISLGQLYAVVSLVKAGLTMFATSIGKMRRIQRFMETRKPVATTGDDTGRFINASLVQEGMMALRSMFIGFILFFLGLSFNWLFANSWHITETDWIGGLPGLIHALTVMEIGLVPLLYFMWKDGSAQLAKATRMKNMAQQLRAGTLKRKELDLGSLEALTGWKPFWATWTRAARADAAQEEKALALEKTAVENSLDELFGKQIEKNNDDDDDGEKEDKIRKELRQAKADEVSSAASVARMEGYREFLYFILNFIAFYGYLLSVIAFYYPHPFNQDLLREGAAKGQEEQFNNTTPLMVRRLMFHLDPDLADWRGNFAGDFMWTVEPIVILASPIFISWIKPKGKQTTATTAAGKTKAD
jgi:hypothetical protein